MSIYTDYSYGLEQSMDMGLGILGGLVIFIIIMFIISIAISVIMIIALWKIFVKLGKKGWISLIPFYNNWVLFETQEIKGWWSLIPVANIIFMCIAYYKLAINFEKSKGFAICTVIFPYVCLPILAFSKSKEVNKTELNINKQQTSNDFQEQVELNNTNNEERNETNNTINNYSTLNQMGTPIENNISNEFRYCTECGSKNTKDSSYCTNCGTKLQ